MFGLFWIPSVLLTNQQRWLQMSVVASDHTCFSSFKNASRLLLGSCVSDHRGDPRTWGPQSQSARLQHLYQAVPVLLSRGGVHLACDLSQMHFIVVRIEFWEYFGKTHSRRHECFSVQTALEWIFWWHICFGLYFTGLHVEFSFPFLIVQFCYFSLRDACRYYSL